MMVDNQPRDWHVDVSYDGGKDVTKYVKYTPQEQEYIWMNGKEPKTVDGILTMNYCMAWCKAWGKSLDDWFASGFNDQMYSPIKCKEKSKKLKMQMEMGV